VKLLLDIKIPDPPVKINHADPILLMGSCFSAHIGELLRNSYFNALYNPTGILFDPVSVCRHLGMLQKGDKYSEDHLRYYNELFYSWDFHSSCSRMKKEEALDVINAGIEAGNAFLNKAGWLVITLGTAYVYRLKTENKYVSNCHKVPAGEFDKILLSAEQIAKELSLCLQALKLQYPGIQVIFTLSPVRHVRDGVVENTRSKGRLHEAIHQVCEQLSWAYYFPSYELITDVLRDYRFFEADLVHPNKTAVQYVFDVFCDTWLDSATKAYLPELKQVFNDSSHRMLHEGTKASQEFLERLELRKKSLRQRFPWLEI
jgi:hypothetical protein